jgi:hypothetical protein
MVYSLGGRIEFKISSVYALAMSLSSFFPNLFPGCFPDVDTLNFK